MQQGDSQVRYYCQIEIVSSNIEYSRNKVYIDNTVYVADALECKRAVKWLCDYISYQCWRPPPAHSKDLHSSIVAAFSCLTTWLTAHPQLLQVGDFIGIIYEISLN